MGRFDDIRSSPKFSELTPLAAEDARKLREEVPEIPRDYVEFLSEIGWGSVDGWSYMLYSGPEPSDGIYDPETAEELKSIAFFGDDYNGFNAGFDRDRGWGGVEVDSADMSVEIVAETFEAFVRTRLINEEFL